MSQIAAGSAVSGVSGSVGRFSFLVVHVGSGLLEEGIKHSGRFDAHGFSELGVGEETPLQQVSLHMVPIGDLDGFPVEAVNKLSQGLIVLLDDGLESHLGLWVSPRRCE